MSPHERHGERGVTLVTAAITLPVIMIVLGLAVDLGIAYNVRTAAQAAADSAALAGAYSYVVNANVSDTDVKANAVTAGQQNLINGQAANVSNVQTFTCNNAHCVSTTVSATSVTFFARLFSWTSLPVAARATARASLVGSGTYCAKPVFAPKSLLKNAKPGDLITIRPTTPSGALVPGNYYSLDFSSIAKPTPFTDGSSNNGGGAQLYDDGWTKCLAAPIRCDDIIQVENGNLGNNNNKDYAQYVDTYVSVGKYLPPGAQTPFDTSNSLVPVAVWDDTIPPKSGKISVPVVGFAQIFVNPFVAPNLTAHFIAFSSCSGAGNPGPGTGPYGALIQLIQ